MRIAVLFRIFVTGSKSSFAFPLCETQFCQPVVTLLARRGCFVRQKTPEFRHVHASAVNQPVVGSSPARGMTVGRNMWGFPQVGPALSAFQMVIHDDMSPAEALDKAGLP